MADPAEISALTLNCWGLKYISALRTERLAEIGRRLALLAAPPLPSPPPSSSSSSPSPAAPSSPLSIVALQECWCYEDFAAIHNLTRHVLPYAKFFHSGVWGAGLAVLSRWPITQTSMTPYSLNGRPTAFWRGDWFVGKGLASATVRVSASTTLEVLVTHTHAPYEGGQPDDSYLLHQLAQTWEAGKRIRAAAERGRLVLAMGDFNMTPDSLPYQTLFLGAGNGQEGLPQSATAFALHDSWRDLHPNASLGAASHPLEQARQRQLSVSSPAIPTAAYNLAENGAASDNVLNTWRWPKDKQKRLHRFYRQRQQRHQQPGTGTAADVDLEAEFVVPPDTPDPRAKRLDYVFYASPALAGSSNPVWRTKAARVEMVDRHPTLGCSVSDHYAVAVTLARAALESEPEAASSGIPHPHPTDAVATPLATYDAVLAESDKYMLREQKQRYWRGVHFFVSVAVVVGCLVAVWFVPRNFVAFLLTLLATLGLATGVVDGLMALLFFGSEIRYMKEFHWEICNSQAAATGSARVPPLSSHTEDK
ncbi:phospholipase C type enzyme [Sporothrix curviconia]|uniref:Phospholipase C type enzyme n=1 Tax=Sporothrix curviconia TaxID=1260050 RepID=A0ABP0BJ22_9PEZI